MRDENFMLECFVHEMFLRGKIEVNENQSENNVQTSVNEIFHRSEQKKRLVAFYTLGCKVNHYETEGIAKQFLDIGYTRIDFDSETEADVYVINTCSVTNTGDKKSRQMIRRAIRKNPNAIVCVTGCYAQTAPAEVLKIEGVDLVIGTQGRENLLHYIAELEKTRTPINAVSDIMKTKTFETLEVEHFSDRTRETLKIQEGCNNFCTFCLIPWARGLLRSRAPEDVILQVKRFVSAGYKEVVLTGIHTGAYGVDFENYRLFDLMKDLDQIDGLYRVRISSIEATQVTDEMIQLIQYSGKFANHLHMPIQSGSNGVLKRMRRKYTAEEFCQNMMHIVSMLPDIAITTDVIVGFPGETEEEFMETYRLIEAYPFSELHVFPYSKRTGTPAATMEQQVDEDVKHARVEKLIALSNQKAQLYAEKFLGKMVEVIPETAFVSTDGTRQVEGHAGNYLKVVFPGESDLIGKVVQVEIVEAGYPFCKGKRVAYVSHKKG